MNERIEFQDPDKKLVLFGFWPGKKTQKAVKTTFLLDRRCNMAASIDRKLNPNVFFWKNYRYMWE